MFKNNLIVTVVLLLSIANVNGAPSQKLFGNWKGVKMFQDQDSYDGEQFFLPNEGEMILSENSLKLYYYPYFKGAEFKITYTEESILYNINDKQIRTDYSFRNDTLVFKMHYIDKVFVKYFVATRMEKGVIYDLDKYGFRTQKLVHEFELDTLQLLQRKGFNSYDSLGFTPFKYLQFTKNNTLIINRNTTVVYQRNFKEIEFSYEGRPTTITVASIGGTQSIAIKPTTFCQCDSLIIPYMTVEWADRVRQAIIDEENF